MISFNRLIFVFLLLSVFLSTPLLSSVVTAPHIKVELISENDSLTSQAPNWVGVRFEIEENWHLYWKNPGDSGEEPKIAWDLPTFLTAGGIQWPTPTRIPYGPLMNFGYSDALLLMVPLSLASTAETTNVNIKANVKWLVCSDVCIPGSASLLLTLPIAQKKVEPTKWGGQFQEVRANLPGAIPSEWGTKISAKGKSLLISWEKSPFPRNSRIEVFPDNPDQIENAVEQKAVWANDSLEITIARSEVSTSPVQQMDGVLSVEGEGYRFSLPVEGAAPAAAPQTNEAGFDLLSLLQALLFAFLGGLILNLMPCVFPVLSLKALGIVELAQNRESRTVKLQAIFYTLGILVSFWILAIIILAFRASGELIGWGFQLQSPVFVLIVANVLLIMSLNLFGIFEFAGSFGVGSGLAARKGYEGSFFTGILATIVATPCTAPFMGTALAFALSQSALNTFLVFTFLGAGLAAPYCAISLAPGLSRLLPRPGRWMATFKTFMGFPLLATVIWLVFVFGAQTGLDSVTNLLIGFLALGLSAWIFGRWQLKTAKIVALLIAVFAVFIQLPGSPELKSAQWQSFSPAKLLQLSKENKPVFLDFTAAWCVTCKVNEMVAFTEPVMKEMAARGVVAMKVDWTNGDPEITQMLAGFGRNGVPLYVLYTGKENEAPRILPQILTPKIVLDELKNVSKEK